MLQIRTTDRFSFKNCRLKWDFASPLRGNWEPNLPPQPLWLGSAMHKAWEVYYDPATPRDSTVAIAAYTLWCEKRLTQYRHEQGDLWADQMVAYNESFELGLKVLQFYFLLAPKLDDFEVIWTEKDLLFLLDLGTVLDGEEIYYGARLDGLVRDNYGECWILEHKSAASLPTSTEYLEKDDQCASYIWLVKKKLGIECAGVLYNIVRKEVPHKPKVLKNGNLSKDRAQNTTYDLYVETIEELGLNKAEYTEFLDFLKEFPKKWVHREKVRRTKFEVDSMEERITNEAIDMLDSPRIYPNPSKMNCNGCWFEDPCTAKLEGQDVQFVLDTQYKQRPLYDETVTDVIRETAWQ